MQMMMQEEVNQGFLKMKFALNHPWLFHNLLFSYLPGLFQAISSMLVIIVNYLAIYTDRDPMAIVTKFLAFKIVSTVDNTLFATYDSRMIAKALVLAQGGDSDKFKDIK